MDQSELFSRLGVALAIGLLVGLERGWQRRDEPDHQRAAGFRTFALTGLLGGVTGLLSRDGNGLLIGLVFLGFAGAFTLFHWLEAEQDRDVSVTSVVAGMLTFLLGCLAMVGDIGVAVAGAVAMTVLLTFREQLHRWVASLSWREISAVTILLAMTFLLLPVLPNRTVDPWGVLNPFEIWLLTVLIAAVSFAGYVAVKVLGERMGVIVAALAGGLASSTATTLTLARLGRGRPEAARLLSSGILLAGLVMVVRVTILTAVLNPALLGIVLVPLGVGGAILALASLLFGFGTPASEHPKLEIDNPLAIGTALKLALLIVVVMLAAALLRWAFGALGVLLVAAASGILDADAITISMVRQAGAGLAGDTAAHGILVAVAVNTVSKAVLAAGTGGRAIGLLVGLASLAAIAGGALALLLVPALGFTALT